MALRKITFLFFGICSISYSQVNLDKDFDGKFDYNHSELNSTTLNFHRIHFRSLNSGYRQPAHSETAGTGQLGTLTEIRYSILQDILLVRTSSISGNKLLRDPTVLHLCMNTQNKNQVDSSLSDTAT